MRLVIKDGLVVTPKDNGAWQGRADIVVEDDLIAHVGQVRADLAEGADRVIDASGHIVMPGFVDAHVHSKEIFAKGRARALPMEISYLRSSGLVVSPMLAPAEPEEIYARTLLAGVEIVKQGVTTVIDDVLHVPAFNTDSVNAHMKAYADLGLRARVTTGVMNRPWSEFMSFVAEVMPPEVMARFPKTGHEDAEKLLAWCREIIQETHSDTALVQPILAASTPDRCTPELLVGISRLAREYNLPVDIHTQENIGGAVSGHLSYGGTHVKYLDDLGFLSEHSVLIHAVWLTSEDIHRLAARGAAVVHNPVSNMKLGAGIAPVRELLDSGVQVGLGCDGFSCNDSHNMFETMKMAGLLQNVTTPVYDDWPTPEEVLHMATEGGACAHLMGGQVGRIAAGYKADLVLLRLDTPPFRPLNNALHQIVYCENGASVDTVIVDGRVVVEGRRLLSMDEDKVVAEALSWHQRFLERVQPAWQLAAELEPYFRRAYLRCVEHVGELEMSRFGQVR